MLNCRRLLVDSFKVRELLSTIFEIIINTINKRTGGSAKYIIHHYKDFVINLSRGEDYRREFTDALREYIQIDNFKYIVYTNKLFMKDSIRLWLNWLFRSDRSKTRNPLI